MSVVATPRAPLDVLIAEDDGDVRLAVRQLLEAQGYTCAEAADGGAAVRIARESPPRLVLLDLMMPVVDGFAAAKRLRADPQTRGVRIHCLTALDFPAARRAALDAGCDGFLAKPFTPDDLYGAVSAAIYSLRLGDDAFTQARERLQQTLAAPVAGRERQWSQQLAAALDGLEKELRRPADHPDEAEGWFAQVDLCRPTLARRAAALVQERGQLLEQTRALKAEVQRAAQGFQPAGGRAGASDALPEPAKGWGVLDFSAIRETGERLAAACARQAHAEREVVFESINTDIGVGD
jgi:two-component system cell cycle response regulator DivK